MPSPITLMVSFLLTLKQNEIVLLITILVKLMTPLLVISSTKAIPRIKVITTKISISKLILDQTGMVLRALLKLNQKLRISQIMGSSSCIGRYSIVGFSQLGYLLQEGRPPVKLFIDYSSRLL